MSPFRESHQPEPEFNEPLKPGGDELAADCATSAALILAIECATTPLVVRFEGDKDDIVCKSDDPLPRPLQAYQGKTLVAHAMKTALDACIPHVAVLAGGDGETQEKIAEEARAQARAKGVDVVMVGYDPLKDAQATRDAANFEFNGLTKGVLDCARSLLEGNGLDSVIVMSCDQVRIEPRHLLRLCRAFHANPRVDAAASWIEWLRRTPILLSRRFLESLDRSPRVERLVSGSRPMPSLDVADVLFGEERLAANQAVPAAVGRFLKDSSLSALEAVAIARDEIEREGGGGDFPKRSGADSQSKADRELIAIAREVIRSANAAMDEEERKELSWADGWGRRCALDFPLLANPRHKGKLAYLDSAATAQRVDRAILAQLEFDTAGNANIYRGTYELSARSTAAFNDARKTLEEFIGAKRRETVFTANASASAGLVAQAWGKWNIGEGDLIVTTVEEHHSNLLPWFMLAQRKKAHVAYIPLLGDGRLDLRAYEKLLEERPKLVCAAHIGNVMGILNPVCEMARMAHAANARFYLDAAQSIPHVEMNVRDLGADFVGFSAHKMYGPLGIGGLWIAPEAFAEMDPLVAGGGSISHVGFQSYYLRQGAIQYETGTPPISQAIGWAAAVEYLDALGMGSIKRHSAVLTRHLLRCLSPIESLTIWGGHDQPDGQTGLVSFSAAGIAPAAMGSFCGKLGVAIRTGGHCAVPLSALMGVTGTCRASVAVHTVRADIEALAVAVEACRRTYSAGRKENR